MFDYEERLKQLLEEPTVKALKNYRELKKKYTKPKEEDVLKVEPVNIFDSPSVNRKILRIGKRILSDQQSMPPPLVPYKLEKFVFKGVTYYIYGTHIYEEDPTEDQVAKLKCSIETFYKENKVPPLALVKHTPDYYRADNGEDIEEGDFLYKLIEGNIAKVVGVIQGGEMCLYEI
jgi:hypothetical protein